MQGRKGEELKNEEERRRGVRYVRTYGETKSVIRFWDLTELLGGFGVDFGFATKDFS